MDGSPEIALPPPPAERKQPTPPSSQRGFQLASWLQSIRQRFHSPPAQSQENTGGESRKSPPEQFRDLMDLGREEAPTREEVLDYLRNNEGGKAKGKSMRQFTIETGQWEVVTKELVDGFANYYIQRAQELHKSSTNPLRIVEVGAGNGRLAHFLRKKINEKGFGDEIIYIATDGGEGSRKKPNPDVLKGVDYKDALSLRELDGNTPDIVIASWPRARFATQGGDDWTEAFREAGVGEYILIGNSHGSGHPLHTWGEIAVFDQYGFNLEETKKAQQEYERKKKSGELRADERPLYEVDGRGYRRLEPEETPILSAIPLLGAKDSYDSDEPSASKIVVFRGPGK